MRNKRLNREKRSSLPGNQGTTMVEVLVAFTVLLIVLGLIYGMIAFTSVLRMRAQDASAASQSFASEMYNKKNAPLKVPAVTESELEPGEEPEEDTVSAISKEYEHIIVRNYETRDNIPLFYLSLNTDDTEEANFGENGKNLYQALSSKPGSDATEDEIRNDKKNKEKYWLSLYNIEAVTYVYKPEEGMETEHIIIPKAVHFIHKSDKEDLDYGE